MLSKAVRKAKQPIRAIARFKSSHVTATADVSVEDAKESLHDKPVHMSNSEAFVETMVAHGVTDTFGIVGSAFMDALDLWEPAGIRFISVAHEQNAAHMADGYARASGRHGVCIAQNGPGISNFFTGIAAAYWAHSPVVCITPEAGTMTKGLGGFQELDQIPVFEAVTKFQAHINNPARMAELSARAFDIAKHERGPVQINIPRDYFYGENTFTVPSPKPLRHSAGSEASLAEAAEIIASSKRPCILAGGGVAMGNGVEEVQALAELLGAPVATTYLHNDSFPCDHPLACGPLGYQGHKSAMHAMHEADVVIALGSRLSPFGTLPQYDFDYFPRDAKVIQVDIDARRLGMSRACDVLIHGDCKQTAADLTARLADAECLEGSQERAARVSELKEAWEAELDALTGSNEPQPEGRMKPRAMLREIERALPDDAMVATDIGNICSVSNSYLRFKTPNSYFAAMTYGNCGYAFPAAMGAKVASPERPSFAFAGDGAWGMSLNEVLTCVREEIPTTAVVFNNGQWGAEKKNQILWFGDRYIGTQLKGEHSYADIARSMGAEGITVSKLEEVGPAIRAAAANQKEGKTTVVEMMVTKELGDPFRRDAMALPQRVLSKYADFSEKSESATGQATDFSGTSSAH